MVGASRTSGFVDGWDARRRTDVAVYLPANFPCLLWPCGYTSDKAPGLCHEGSSCRPCCSRDLGRISQRAVACISAFGIAIDGRGARGQPDRDELGGDCGTSIPCRTLFRIFVPPQKTEALGVTGRESPRSRSRPMVVCGLGL